MFLFIKSKIFETQNFGIGSLASSFWREFRASRLEVGRVIGSFSFGCISLEIWELSSVGSEHLPYKQGVIGSNPIAPTTFLYFNTIPMKHFFAYIIYSSSHNIYYIGQTNDLDDRMIRHSSNRSKFTKGKGPWELISSIKDSISGLNTAL